MSFQSFTSFTSPRYRYQDVAADVAKMSIEEQEAIQQDLLGDRPRVHETEEIIRRSIEQLHEEIQMINPKEAYETAQIVCPNYVNSDEFLLLFLRAERFDIKLAAKRIVCYWNEKVGVFGEENAFHQISLNNDFDGDDQHALMLGGFKVLPIRDTSGRVIILSHRALWDTDPSRRKSMERLLWYMVHKAVQDINVQRDGVVFILYSGIKSFSHENADAKLSRKLIRQLRDALPVRIAALHQIIPNQLISFLAELVLHSFGRHLRARYRQHSGTSREIRESFTMYGILPTALPTALPGGELEFDYEEWLHAVN